MLIVDLLPWMVALPCALWEFKLKTQRTGLFARISSSFLVFVGVFLWVWLVQFNFRYFGLHWIDIAKMTTLCLAPPAVALVGTRHFGFAAGVWGGVFTAVLTLIAAAAIGIGVYGL